VTDVSVEELTERYSDVGDLGVSTFVSNNSYDTYTYRPALPNGIMAMVYWFNVVVYYIILYFLLLIKIRFFWPYMLLMLLESNIDIFEILDVASADSLGAFVIHAAHYICYSILYLVGDNDIIVWHIVFNWQ